LTAEQRRCRHQAGPDLDDRDLGLLRYRADALGVGSRATDSDRLRDDALDRPEAGVDSPGGEGAAEQADARTQDHHRQQRRAPAGSEAHSAETLLGRLRYRMIPAALLCTPFRTSNLRRSSAGRSSRGAANTAARAPATSSTPASSAS